MERVQIIIPVATMVDVGHFSLVAAFLVTVFGFLIGVVGAYRKDPRQTKSSVFAVHVTAILGVVSLCWLGKAFLEHDYSNLYVWRTSNNAMSPMYLISAIWGGMDGSMLLWAVLMICYQAAALLCTGDMSYPLRRWVVVVFHVASLFFLGVVTFLTNPFRLIPEGSIPLDGNGLNPLLQNPSMMIHPPTLYLGFTGFVVPFAFAGGALINGAGSEDWIRLVRRWTLIAWGFLTAGIVLGGHWAYIELGWGGFWAWDPVENASFFPWLTGTALLHSIIVEQQRGMLRKWNIFLAILTYMLTVFGTFLTRSGVVQSVHAFAESDIGWVFLVYLGFLGAITLGLLVYRSKDFPSRYAFQSLFSRESLFLFNNVLLLSVCFATMWGVLFPVISEAITGNKQVVGPPFFNKVNTPLFLLLMLLMAIGPLLSWRKTSWPMFRRIVLGPFFFCSAIFLGLFFYDTSRIEEAISFSLCVFVVLTVYGEFKRGLKVRKQLIEESSGVRLVKLIRRKPARYGGFIVHLGVAVAVFSITASMAYKLERDVAIEVGGSTTIGGYTLTLTELVDVAGDNYSAVRGRITVRDDEGGLVTELLPERRFYHRSEEVTTEVDIHMTPLEDLYVALAGLEFPKSEDLSARGNLDEAKAALKLFLNPFQFWLWIGTLIVLFGTGIALIGSPVIARSEVHQSVSSSAVRSSS